MNKLNAGKTGHNRLSPYLTPTGAWALAVGTSIGWGALVVTSTTYLSEAGVLGSIAGLVIGAVIMLIISRCYHYMMNSIPDCGGAYAFTKETFGYDHGFLSAWFLVLTYLAMFWANATSMPLFARYFLGDPFMFGFHYSVFGYDVYFGEALLVICTIAIAALICTADKKLTIGLMKALVIILTAGIIICWGVSTVGRGAAGYAYEPLFSTGSSPVFQIIRIACISPWAYIGFENISNSAEEFSFPHTKSFRILACSVVTALVLYICVILLSASAYPEGYANWLEYIKDLQNIPGRDGLPAFYAAKFYLGFAGTAIMVLVMFALITTSLIANLIAISRILYSMAGDEIVPTSLRSLNKRGIPSRAIWFTACFSMLVPFLGRAAIGWIVDVTTIGATIIFGFVSASAYKMAKSRGDIRYRTYGLAGVALMIAFALYLLLFNLLTANSLEAESYFLFTVWAVFGFIFFLSLLRKDYAKKFGKSTVVWIALLLLILFTSLVWMNQSSVNSAHRTMDDVREYYVGENIEYTPEETEFMDREISELRYDNVKSMLVVILLFAVSLGIHMALQKKHEKLEKEKIRADEESRAKSQFLFNMSHDIRTPMNAIIGFTHLAQKEGVTEGEKDDYLVKIENSGQQLLDIINDVLDMSRIENGKIELDPVVMDIDSVLTEAWDLFAHQMKEKEINFNVDCIGIKDHWVLCDRARFNRILLNLLSNAYKFTPPGGKVSAIITQTDSSETTGTYELHVKDTGIGMTPEFLENVFTPFERARTSTVSGIQGTGLGLSIAKGIVDVMGGEIEVMSEPDKGSEFVITLTFPVVEAPEEAGEAEDKRAFLDFSKMRLLLVEDNAVNMEIANMILSSAGFTIEQADDGSAAVEMVSRSAPGYYDAVLMDIQMPVMNGYEATKAIRAMPEAGVADVPIIAMTANVFQEDIQAAHNAGMDEHIAKPLDVTRMMDTLTSVLAKGRHDMSAEQ